MNSPPIFFSTVKNILSFTKLNEITKILSVFKTKVLITNNLKCFLTNKQVNLTT
ncbi:hypothetical protein IQ02_01457 [Flavobacterium glaciei]|uniref:Uncharacterized protein n=1 Tax=Flavobacterium glaciei TaxID=386300 RepID=A0A562PTV5_9FLAO|nr:hypothetical protein DFR66_10670 [Flavobacterium glaciei]TWI47871.1 hypothetical protein IQ02_01457 [Flavobacterium glaciei]